MSGGKVILADAQDDVIADIGVLSRGLGAISEEQLAVDQGRFYLAQAYNATLANAANLDMTLVVPDNGIIKAIGFAAYFASEADSDVLFYRNPTVNVEGTPYTPLQRNGLSSSASACTVRIGDTFTALGTLRTRLLLTGGSGGKRTGDIADDTRSIIQPGQTVLIRMTNVSGQAERALSTINWVEYLN